MSIGTALSPSGMAALPGKLMSLNALKSPVESSSGDASQADDNGGGDGGGDLGGDRFRGGRLA